MRFSSCLAFILFLLPGTTAGAQNVIWTNSSGSSLTQDNHHSLPKSVAITLTLQNETVELKLSKKQDDDLDDIPVILGDNDTVRVWQSSRTETFSMYTDESKSAFFSLAIKSENGTDAAEYYGSFVHKGIKYSLIPKQYLDKSDKTINFINVFLNGSQHIIYEDKNEGEIYSAQGITANDVIKTANIEDGTTFEKMNSFNISKRSLRNRRSPSLNLVVDLMVVIDNSMYKKWLKLNNGNKDQSIKRMRYYLAHIVNGINNVYSSMEVYQLSLEIVGIFIAETERQSPYFENPRAKSYLDNERISFTAALDDFSDWVSKHKLKRGELPTKEKFLQEHDVAVAFTDYHESPRQGLAKFGSVCEVNSQAIVHAQGHYSTISTAAHEIAHVLGSRHDGDGNDCNHADQYLMSPLMSYKKLDNWNKFSRCSIDDIINKVKVLERRGKNCLDSSKKRRKRLNLGTFLEPNPGVRFGPDEQCKLKFGEGYKFCSNGRDSHLTMCSKLSCLKIEDSGCYTSYPTALDGTTCAKGKWCMEGECVSGAPEKPDDKDTCYFGDKLDIFRLNNVPTRCSDFLKEPRLCYKFDNWCCETCENIKKEKDIPLANCPYGDKGMTFNLGIKTYGCEIVFRRPDICLDPDNAEHCCESCSKVKKDSESTGTNIKRLSPTECEDEDSVIYDDNEITCVSLRKDPVKCYDLEQHCCKTCSEARNNRDPNCPYGDRDLIFVEGNKEYGCELIMGRPDLCGDPRYEKNCCESCARANKPLSSTTKAPERNIEKPMRDVCRDKEHLMYDGREFNCDFLHQRPDLCYQLSKYCCQTCGKIQKNKECEDEDSVIYGDNEITCASLRKDLVKCYDLEQRCCKTCSEARNNRDPNCPYGDRDIIILMGNKKYGCELIMHRPDLCGNPKYEKNCCESCARANKPLSSTTKAPERNIEKPMRDICRDKEHFMYDGREFNCDFLHQRPDLCYQLSKYCCQTCGKIQKNKVAKLGPNCPYGDHNLKTKVNGKELDCSALIRWNPVVCTDHQTAKFCCESCSGITAGLTFHFP